MMNSFKKTILIVLTLVMVFTSLPIQFTNWSGLAHVYAEESLPDIPPDEGTSQNAEESLPDIPPDEVTSRSIDLLVEPVLSDAEAVALDKAWLSDIVNDYFLPWLQEDLSLPTTGTNGSSIEWLSSNTSLVNIDGKVNRPAYIGISSYDVTLSANITNETANDTLIFEVSVAPLFGSLAVQLDWEDIESISASDFLTFNGKAEPGVIYMSNPYLFLLNNYSEVGSVFTKKKIQLADDLSFSTYFLFDISSMYQKYDEGFTFTLQASSDTALGTGLPSSLGVPDGSPSLSVEFDTKRDSESAPYEYQGTDTEQHLAVYINGDYENPIEVAPAAVARDDGTREFSVNQRFKVWIQYDGIAKKLEVYEVSEAYSFSDEPLSPVISVDLDLTQIFKTPDGDTIQDVYAGFTGHGSEYSVHASIYQWNFKNDPYPIEYDLPYSIQDLYIDASNVSLSTKTIDHESAYSSTFTAIIKDSLGEPVPGVPVTFNTDFGVLDASQAITDANGRVNGTLISLTPGTAKVRATAQGGAYAEADAYLIMTDEAKINIDYDELTADQLLNGNQSLDFVRGNLDLPLVGTNGSTISWSSSNEAFLTSTGIVSRPTAAQGDQTVTLTATLSNGTVTRSKELPVKIKILDADIVALDSVWLTDRMILNGNTSWDKVMSNLFMPDTGENGSVIEWTSSLEGLITVDGTVNRPLYPAQPASVLLSVTLSMGEASINKEFSIQVVPLEATDNDMLREAYDALQIILNDNSDLSHIRSNISLALKGLHDIDISWDSSNLDVIDEDGKVYQPTFTTGDTVLTLTATLTKGLESTEKIFQVMVLALDPTNQEAVDETKFWLTEGQIRNTNPSLTEVTSDLLLQTNGLYSAQISWESDSLDVIGVDGKVTRPSFSDGDKTVQLTANIKRGDYTVTKVFDVTVKRLVSTDLEALSATEVWLTPEKILGDNENSSQVEKSLSLPVAGLESTTIKWQCTPESVISVEPSTIGQITPPSFVVGDIAVTLVATITRGDISLEKTFEVIVKALPLDDEVAVALDYDRLKIENTLGLNPSPYSVTGDLTFSTTSAYGSVITYQSNISDAFTLRINEDQSITGVVTRPDYEESHRRIIVTVTITKGSQEKIKTFEYTILALRDITPPVPVSITPANNSVDVAYNTKETIIRFNEEIIHPDGLRGYGYLPKYLNITLNGSLMSDDYMVRFVGNDLMITNRFGVMPTGKNEIVIPASAVKDKSGNFMTEDISIAYTVEERIVRNISIASSMPANGATNVPINSEISFTFDTTGLIKGSMFNEIAFMNDKYPKIPIVCELKDDKVTVSFKYEGWGLEKGKMYWLMIPGGAVQDRFLNQNKFELICFSVLPETVRPTVVSTFPRQNETKVSVLQHIQIHYKEGVMRAGGKVRVTDEAGSPVEVAISELKDFDTTINLIPLKPLQPNTRYNVVMSSDFVKTKIAPHEPSSSDYTFSFTTGEDALSIQSMNPMNLSESVPVNDSIHLVFNHPIKEGPNYSLMSMMDSAGTKVSIFDRCDGNMSEIKLLSMWMDPDETYTIIIPAGVFSDDEENHNNSLAFTFTTGKNLVLSSGDSFSVNPSSRYYVNKKITFDTVKLQETFRRIGRKLVSCAWNFGDGQTASGLKTDHSYTLPGNYTITLTVKDNTGMEYALTQDVSIQTVEQDKIEILVTPEKIQNLIREDTYIDPLDGLPGRRLYKVYIRHEGVYLPDEKINVQLYKNGEPIKEMGTITTQFLEKGVPVAYFTFDYKNPSYLGNYQLVFTYGDKSLLRTVRIADQRQKQDLWIQPVNTLTDEPVNIYSTLAFDVDGVEYIGEKRKDADTLEYFYVIPNLQTGFHKIKLNKQEWTGHSSEVMDFWHTSTEQRALLPVKANNPGISRVWGSLKTGNSSIEISSNMKDYKTFIYLTESIGLEPVRFHIDVDWGGVNPGYFEIQYNGWTEKIFEPWFDFVPDNLYPGSKLLVRAVNPMGDPSPWVDCKIAVVDPPTNPYVWLTYVDGEYQAETDMMLTDNRAGQIEGLHNMPLMDHEESFGIGSHYEVNYGKIEESDGKLLLNMSSNLGGSYGKSKKKPKMVSVGYEIEVEQESQVYLIYDPAVGSWKMETGEFSLWGDISVFREKGKVVPIIDLGAKGKITLGTIIGGTLYMDNSPDAVYNNSGILTIEPYATGEIYGGIKGFNVEGFVRGSVNAQVHIPTGYIQVVPELTSKITNTICFVKSTVFDETYTTSWNNGKIPVTPPKRSSLYAVIPGLSEEAVPYEVIPRQYIQQDTEWVAPSHHQMMRKSADADTLLKNNIYPYADVQLVKKGDTLVALWIDDNQERTDFNRTQLFTSTNTDSTWSLPVSLDQDGTADFDPAITTTDTDLQVAWQDFDGIFSEKDSLDEIFKKSEISVTGGDGLVTLSQDDYYDHTPVIESIGNQSAMTVWIKSDDYKAPQGGEGTDRLMYSVWNGSHWSMATTLQENMPLVSDCSLIAGEDSYLLLYTHDSDHDVTTPEDNEVWARVFDTDSNTWGEPVRLTENSVQDSNPQGIYFNDDWFITWYQEDRYVYRHGLASETLATESLAGVSGKIALTQGDNFLALVYQKGGENNNRNLSTLFYDFEKRIWSHEIPLTSGSGYVRSFSPAFDSDGNLGLLYTHADIITEGKDGTEYYVPGNNVRLMFSTYTPIHDLALANKDAMILSHDNPIPETSVQVTCMVENKGDFAEMATVTLYDGTPEKGVKIDEVTTTQLIPARSSIPVILEWLVPAEERTEYNLYAKVKVDEGIVETDYANNTASVSVSLSDVELLDVKWESLAGYEYIVKPLIFNNGSTSLDNINVIITYNKKEVASTVLKKLEPGERAHTSFIISSESLSESVMDRYPMTVTVSLAEGIKENSLENNVTDFELNTKIIMLGAMNPADGQKQVGIDEPITLRFNRLITEKDGYGDIKLTDSSLNAVPVTKTIDQNVMTITAVNGLRHSTKYTLDIPENAIGDAYGRSMRSSESIGFTTVTQNPVPIFSFPYDESIHVETDSDIRIQYSEAIKIGSTFNNIYLERDADNIKIPVFTTLDKEWLILKPIGKLGEYTEYSVHIPRGAVKNLSEDNQADDFELSFTTQSHSDDPIEDPGSDSGTSMTPSNPQELSLKLVEVDRLLIKDLSTGQDGFYTLDLIQEANLWDGVQVTLSTHVLNQLLTARLGLRITTEKGELTFPEEWIRTIPENEEQSVIITIGERKQNTQYKTDNTNRVSELFTITVTVDGRPLIEFEDRITVVLPLHRGDVQNGQRVIACRYDELTGTWIPLGGKVDMDAGTITFRTGHFSDFAAFETVRSFDDVIATWAKEPVEILASRGLINGKDEGVFDPTMNITRAEITAIVIRSLYIKPSTNKGTFTDVAFDAWYAENVETAAALEIMKGMGEGLFAPLDNMTREQLAVIAYRLIGRKSVQNPQETTVHSFLDQDEISSYAREGVKDLTSKGIMIGSFGKFNPKTFVTRQEAAVVLYRLLQHIGEI